MKKTNGYKHILQYTGLFGGVQTLNILVGMVRNKLVAMILGPDGMGLISLCNSTLKLMSDSTNFGISISAVKNISEYFVWRSYRVLGEIFKTNLSTVTLYKIRTNGTGNE